ncbi:MAG: hypothetical protein ACPIOQ_85820, partial [Promethearchaeia archaeon]
MDACVSGLEALKDAQLFRQQGLPAAALGVKELQIKQEEGKRQPGDFERVLGPIAAAMPLRDASNASRPVVKVERWLLQCVAWIRFVTRARAHTHTHTHTRTCT